MLTFSEERHAYAWNGASVPSVTQVLAAAGLSEFAFVPEEVMTFARERGLAVHAATALDDMDELDEASVDPHAAPYLTAWRRFRRETGFVPTAIEQRVFHPKLMYAGTLDREGTMGKFEYLADLKTGAPSIATGPQTAAYLEARIQAGAYSRASRRKRMAVYLTTDGTYKLIHHTDPNDWSVFVAALTITNWKATK